MKHIVTIIGILAIAAITLVVHVVASPAPVLPAVSSLAPVAALPTATTPAPVVAPPAATGVLEPAGSAGSTPAPSSATCNTVAEIEGWTSGKSPASCTTCAPPQQQYATYQTYQPQRRRFMPFGGRFRR